MSQQQPQTVIDPSNYGGVVVASNATSAPAVVKSDVEQGRSVGGVVVNSTAAAAPPTYVKTSGKATAAMICGIVGIIIFGIILGPIAICLGQSAKQEIKESNGKLKGEGQAQCGVICGVIAVVIWLIFLIAVLAA